MNPTPDQIHAGQAIYTRHTLRLYDLVVMGISNPLVYRCPTQRILEHYNRCVSANHLDVGVGTGYYLDRCTFPTERPRVALMDMNVSALEHASKRIARYAPELVQRNVLEPIAWDGSKFDSVGLGYLLHCLPGDLVSKAVALDHLRELMNPGAVLFGSTLLQGGVQRSAAARMLMKFYNFKRVMCNVNDNLDTLRAELMRRFNDVQIEVVGCVALFAGRV